MDETIPITRQQISHSTPNRIPDVVKQALTSPGESIKTSLPTITVELPSNGYFYPENSPLANGTIKLYEVTAKHEDILNNTTLLKKGTVFDEFLKVIIATPGVSLDDLLIGDKNSIFLAARRSAYGDLYKAKAKCQSCEKESMIVIDLSLVKNKQFDFSSHTRGQNLFTFVLPHSGKVITWKLLTHKDETAIDGELKNLAKLSSGISSPEVTTRLKYTIVSIDGKTDRNYIKTFVDTELTAKDSLAFRENSKNGIPSMDMTYDFICPHCGHEDRVPIPLGSNFFWPGLNE